jgi:N-methylhydantoinase A
VTVERGRDPRDLTLVAFGGNGGIHATELARDLGIGRVVVPPLAGVFSAVGMLACELEHVALLTIVRPLDALRASELRGAKAGLAEEVGAQLAADGFPPERQAFAWEADLRHEGQASELTVDCEGDDPAELSHRFRAEYSKTFGYEDDSPIELVKLRATGRALSGERLDFKALQTATPAGAAAAGYRRAHFERGRPASLVAVVPRSALTSAPRRGPLIIEEFDATILVPAHASVHLDAIGNIVLDLD